MVCVDIMKYFVYVLQNIDRDKIYIGYTKNIDNRLKRHNKELPNKRKSYTSKNSGRWVLIYKEELVSLNDAVKREKWLKSGKGREFIKQFKINNIKLV